MAIEDAAALGILFNKNNFAGSVEESLMVYNSVRLPRATRVQAAAARAAYNINERIGTFGTTHANHKLSILKHSLTKLCTTRLLRQQTHSHIQSRRREEETHHRGDECVRTPSPHPHLTYEILNLTNHLFSKYIVTTCTRTLKNN